MSCNIKVKYELKLCIFFTKDSQHKYQMSLFICFYKIFVKQLLGFFNFIFKLFMYISLSMEIDFKNVVNGIVGVVL
jgi:hypothetical protein